MALPPLTHHEIIELVQPFTRRGRRIDLDASNRLERRLVFKPTDHASATEGAPPLRENLTLEQPFAGNFRLTRVLTPATGQPAALVAEGPEPGALLEMVEAVPGSSHFRTGDGFRLTYSHHVEKEPGATTADPMLTKGVVELDGLTLTLAMPNVRDLSAKFELVGDADEFIELPEDLLAVIGWDWSPLVRGRESWNSLLRVRGKGAERRRRAEEKLERTAAHLARTMAEPPARFHERFLAARWWAAVRRTIPVLTCLAVIVGAVSVPVDVADASHAVMLSLMNLPILLIALSFTLQEASRIEISPLPRRSRAPAWRRARAARPEEPPALDSPPRLT